MHHRNPRLRLHGLLQLHGLLHLHGLLQLHDLPRIHPFVSLLLDLSSPPSRQLGIVGVPSSDFIYNYTYAYRNSTRWAITFDQIGAAPSINVRYQIWFNGTVTANGSDIFGRDLLSVMRGIDETLVSVLNDPSGATPATMDVSLKDWPVSPPKVVSDTIVQQLGPVFFFCSEMIIFITVLNQVVTEKEQKLRHGMEMMGLRPTVYWLSQFISNTALVIINSIVVSLMGIALQFKAFTQTDFGVLFVTFFLFGEGMIMMAFFLTTLVRRSNVAVLLGIFIFVIGLIFESFVFSSGQLGYIWWAPTTAQAGWLVLMFIPFFNFGHMFLDITTLTTGTKDPYTQNFIPGPGFPWSQLYNYFPSELVPQGTAPTDLPYPVQAWYFLIMNCAFYGLLLWYFDNVIPNEFGACHPPWFFLTPKYWGFSSSKKSKNELDWLKSVEAYRDMIPIDADEDDDVRRERERGISNDYFPAVKIVGLRKVYRNNAFSKSKLDKVAVKNTSMTFEEGKLTALLGQNGAGKSTTMNILSGLTPASSGDALMYGFSCRHEMNQIRQIMGICPQHDILFDDLTAHEHLELYAGLKGIPHSEIAALMEERLKAVKLWTVRNVRAGTYSGGMKRRLSLVISTIGDPKIILMDEPTTGMDPVNRRHVWGFIEKFKENRVIILTTHSMEEADVLGDRIAIMAHGRLRALGNSIALKNKYGAGYRISIMVDSNNVATVKEQVQSRIADAILEDDSAGALIYQFPIASTPAIPDFVKWIEANVETKVIKGWGISQTTLEEVFLKLIRDANPQGYSGYEAAR
ncbi:uncharacterized protein BJ171DRAFT_424289 [Polychytrium aggregatum]|uniref:uncharacterized protein n=1 Tax=Polychytrium aggregatum TaxID=110093 RepID=UPI0022FEEEA5|nr:uncharacterized protein BJ171DRAFT_424289 [Polychytrium aggregatum]KAI9204486.1 hypothetical protein BJ171DRAFT_424289 [Polychytrium aggregatum]